MFSPVMSAPEPLAYQEDAVSRSAPSDCGARLAYASLKRAVSLAGVAVRGGIMPVQRSRGRAPLEMKERFASCELLILP